MAIQKLKEILPPPIKAIHTGNEEAFNEFQDKLGVMLPNDYKQFVLTYGVGSIDDFIWVHNPFVENTALNLNEQMSDMLEAYNESRKNHPDHFKFPTFPEKGGILPWGGTDNGDELYWLTQGDPENWKVLIYGTRSSDFVQYALTMTDFLQKVLNKEIICEFFPEDIPSEAPKFTPYE
ncbi:SMI1/KNR4 family protein [Brevibacillus sp. HB1.2]|uniref:SMI1/KNR4 family protein n=1 Tax=Brevibacillus sp. HB1.2 TaxID=2738807 RepID=UPI0015756373|nr:SMI1/KNR4 family protein [Brevibacillus sp. HB1.2]